MWNGLDPELIRQLAFIREQVARRHQPPTHEWPFVIEHDSVLVIRERADGALTAFLQETETDSDSTE